MRHFVMSEKITRITYVISEKCLKICGIFENRDKILGEVLMLLGEWYLKDDKEIKKVVLKH